jgi:DNA-binding protein HU-beta
MDDIKDPQDALPKGRGPGKGAGKGGGGAVPERLFNRQKLIGAVADKTGLPRAKALSAVEAVFELMSHSLKDGKEVRVLGFGAFAVSERKAGKGRDPRTGAEIDVPRSKSVRFRASKTLRELVVDTPVDSNTAKDDEAHAGG